MSALVTEAAAKSTDNVTDTLSIPLVAAKEITTKTVHTLTTYVLRQELNRRESMDINENEINHNSLLKRLIVELVKDELQATIKHTVVVVDEAQASRDAAKAVREQRKLEALERSRARQANPAYFTQRQDSNAEAVAKNASSADAAQQEAENGEGEGGDEKDEEEEEEDLDPFRPYKSKGRAKVAGFI